MIACMLLYVCYHRYRKTIGSKQYQRYFDDVDPSSSSKSFRIPRLLSSLSSSFYWKEHNPSESTKIGNSPYQLNASNGLKYSATQQGLSFNPDHAQASSPVHRSGSVNGTKASPVYINPLSPDKPYRKRVSPTVTRHPVHTTTNVASPTADTTPVGQKKTRVAQVPVEISVDYDDIYSFSPNMSVSSMMSRNSSTPSNALADEGTTIRSPYRSGYRSSTRSAQKSPTSGSYRI